MSVRRIRSIEEFRRLYYPHECQYGKPDSHDWERRLITGHVRCHNCGKTPDEVEHEAMKAMIGRAFEKPGLGA